jgi:hypothetical protein
MQATTEDTGGAQSWVISLCSPVVKLVTGD